MENLKKMFGLLWMILAIVVGYFNVTVLGIPKITSGKQEDLVFGLIILGILTPIMVGGLFVFGYYALKGEYNENK